MPNQVEQYAKFITKEDKSAASLLWNIMHTNTVADKDGNIYVFSESFLPIDTTDMIAIIEGPTTTTRPSDLPYVIQTSDRRFLVLHPKDTLESEES